MRRSDKETNQAWDSYTRECSTDGCYHTFNAPDIGDLLANTMSCPKCFEVYDMDGEDIRFLLAFILSKLEQLDRRTNPFAGVDL